MLKKVPYKKCQNPDFYIQQAEIQELFPSNSNKIIIYHGQSYGIWVLQLIIKSFLYPEAPEHWLPLRFVDDVKKDVCKYDLLNMMRKGQNDEHADYRAIGLAASPNLVSRFTSESAWSTVCQLPELEWSNLFGVSGCLNHLTLYLEHTFVPVERISLFNQQKYAILEFIQIKRRLNRKVSNPKIEETIKKCFPKTYDKYRAQIDGLNDQFQESLQYQSYDGRNREGVLLQIILDRPLADQVCYRSLPFGWLSSKHINSEIISEIEGPEWKGESFEAYSEVYDEVKNKIDGSQLRVAMNRDFRDWPSKMLKLKPMSILLTNRLSLITLFSVRQFSLKPQRHWSSPLKFQVAHFHSSFLLKQKKISFHLADIGEGIKECELIQWFIKEGQEIQQFDKICEVQSDKATVEITSRYDGKVLKLLHQPGQIVQVGAPLIDLISSAEQEQEKDVKPVAPVFYIPVTPDSAQKHAEGAQKPDSVIETAPGSGKQDLHSIDHSSNEILATPAVRRMAREMNLKLSQVKGSGKQGRILKEDLINHNEQKATTAQPEKVMKILKEEKISLTAVQKAMIKSMKQSLQIPHFGFSDEIRMDALIDLRKKVNKILSEKETSFGLSKVSFMPFLLKSFSVSLQEFPLLNAQFKEDHMLYRPGHHIGVAMDTKQGLLVPVLHHTEQLNCIEIAKKLLEYQQKGSSLPPNTFKNPTITMSNIGNIAGKVVHPVLVEGTVCIVGIGRIDSQLKLENGQVTEQNWMTVSFSADHRVVDGATVARFFKRWKQLIEDPVLFWLHSGL